jgi:hypothetical protein
VVFPSILVAWDFMADDDNDDAAIGYSSYASTYVIGSLLVHS